MSAEAHRNGGRFERFGQLMNSQAVVFNISRHNGQRGSMEKQRKTRPATVPDKKRFAAAQPFHEEYQQVRGDERHVTSEGQNRVVLCGFQSRVESSQRTTIRN